MDIRFRSIATWPYPPSPPYKWRVESNASWSSTLALLERELDYLQASAVVVECGLAPRDIRIDGWPRGDARQPMFPGVALHFESKNGHLRYAVDAYRTWQLNLRAIGRGLEALRAVDRYGITRGGEQYRGFAELPSGIAVGAVGARAMNFDSAVRVITQHTDFVTVDLSNYLDAYRVAVKTLHPDVGGDSALFQELQEAKRVLDEYARLENQS